MTQAQSAASRQNGAQSNGPVSEEGKAKSSQNAIKHGLCSARLTFDNPEARAEFEHILTGLIDTYIPTTDPERACVQAMAVAKWREGVVLMMEVRLIEAVDIGEACCVQGGLGLPSLGTILRYKSRIERDYSRARTELDDLRSHRLPRQTPPPEPAKQAYIPMDAALKTLGTNEPSAPANDASLNREQRRKLEAINRKRERK